MKDQDWVACFDKAVEHAFVYGTGFIRITTNGPGGMQLSVVDPKDYRYLEPIEAEEVNREP